MRFLFLVLLLVCFCGVVVARTDPAPNILVIIADDMGYGDLGCLGSQGLETPHIDALAGAGTLCSRAYDGVNLLPLLSGTRTPTSRLLFWRLQGQAAVLTGDDKLIRLAHRPAQFFRVSSDVGESHDLAGEDEPRFRSLFKSLGEWEATLPTVPLWGSSPFWSGQSASHYDTWTVREEPK